MERIRACKNKKQGILTGISFFMSDLIFILTSLIASFLLTFLIMPFGIDLFRKIKFGKQIREEWLMGKATEFARLHGEKSGTPTMWGTFILFSVVILTLFSLGIQMIDPYIKEFFHININHSLWNRNETYIVIFTLLSVWCIGFIDDYLNIRGIGRTKWLSAKVKITLLSLFALAGAYWFYFKLGYSEVKVPFVGWVDFGIFYLIIFVFIVIASANSVNFTDGLDGLAGGLLLFQYAAYGMITYHKGLFILSAFCFIVTGALIAFLWFNIHPAKIFMGDVWSLSLWATLAVIALMTDTIAAFIVMSALFILETLSVIIQLMSKKLRNGKKVFRVAPFHHHLEAIGWHESTIVMRLWLIGIVLSVAGVVMSL